MATYNDMNQVLLKVKDLYEDATDLSRNELTVCAYAHDYNGIGCAIGCLLNPELARQVDYHFSNAPFRSLYYHYQSSDFLSSIKQNIVIELFEDIFDMGKINIDSMVDLQESHDSSETVIQFQFKLDGIINTL